MLANSCWKNPLSASVLALLCESETSVNKQVSLCTFRCKCINYEAITLIRLSGGVFDGQYRHSTSWLDHAQNNSVVDRKKGGSLWGSDSRVQIYSYIKGLLHVKAFVMGLCDMPQASIIICCKCRTNP